MQVVDRVAKWMAIAAGLVLAAVVAITFYDVIMRYVFSAPMRGRQDLVEMGMVVTLTLALPYTWRIGGHITVDIYSALPHAGLERSRTIFVKVLVAAILLLIAWRSWHGAEDAALFNEATNMIMIPHRPFMWLIMVAAALHAALVLAECLFPNTPERRPGPEARDGHDLS